MLISDAAKEDLKWWLTQLKVATNPIRKHAYNLTIFTDASLTGWGACCRGEKAHGWWTVEEKKEHINYLELKAVAFGLKCFARECRNCELLLRVDNTTAVAYVNKMGGIKYPKLARLSREIWQWCESRDIWIHAAYLPSEENCQADEQSRILPRETEWELAN